MKHKPTGEILECPICRAKFPKITKWQKFCSDRCRFESWILKKAAKIGVRREVA